MTDNFIIRDNVLFTQALTVDGQFDVGGNLTISALGAVTGCSGLTLASGTFTDGTASLTSGNWTGIGSCTAITLPDGTLSISGGDITSAGSITATSMTDGMASLTMGDWTGIGSITATTLTDGMLSISGGDIISWFNWMHFHNSWVVQW